MTLTDKPIPRAAGWHILGAGAMGCLWACAMARQDERQAMGSPQVSLLLRDQEALAGYPGQVICSDMEHPLSIPAVAIAGADDQTPLQIHNLLVTTKAQDTLTAVASVANHLSTTSRIVLLQNGLKIQQQLTRLYGAERVFCVSTSHGAWLKAPFDVVHAGNGDAWLGQLDATGTCSRARLQSLRQLLPAEQLNVHIDHDIGARLWRKLAINCAINALTVIHDCRNGELLQIPEARQSLSRLCDEICKVLQAIPEAPPMGDLWTQVQHVLHVTAANVSSTLQDIRRGRHSEIDHLNGYLCELASAQHMPCPVNRAVLQQMRVLESRAIQAHSPTGSERPRQSSPHRSTDRQ